jgi:hypothetical protein
MEYCGAPNRCCKTPPVVIDNQTAAVANPLGFNTVQGVFDTLLGSLQAIIVVLAMIAIVIGGILYITAGGDEGRLKTAKGAITAALVGLALGIAAPSFLKQIGDILGWGSHRSTRSQNSLRYCLRYSQLPSFSRRSHRYHHACRWRSHVPDWRRRREEDRNCQSHRQVCTHRNCYCFGITASDDAGGRVF